MEKKKKKGSGKLLIVIGAVLVALAVAMVSVGTYFEGVLNTYVGMGEAKVVAKPGSENWDSTYYKADKPSADEADKIAKDVTKRIAEEGITLMKNNGILPLGVTGMTAAETAEAPNALRTGVYENEDGTASLYLYDSETTGGIGFFRILFP